MLHPPPPSLRHRSINIIGPNYRTQTSYENLGIDNELRYVVRLTYDRVKMS